MSHNSAKKTFTDWKKGDKSTVSRQDCIEAPCYECNGKQDVDCGGRKSCILYQYSQYNKDRKSEE